MVKVLWNQCIFKKIYAFYTILGNKKSYTRDYVYIVMPEIKMFVFGMYYIFIHFFFILQHAWTHICVKIFYIEILVQSIFFKMWWFKQCMRKNSHLPLKGRFCILLLKRFDLFFSGVKSIQSRWLIKVKIMKGRIMFSQYPLFRLAWNV